MSMRRAKLTSVGAFLLALMTAATLVSTPSPVQAQEEESAHLEWPSYQLQRFRPAPGPADYITVFGSGVAPHLEWTAGTHFNYSSHPMRLDGNSGVSSQTHLDMTGTIGLFDIAEVGLVLPWTMRQRGQNLGRLWPDDDTPAPHLSQMALNDFRLTTKVQALSLEDSVVALSFVGGLSVPLGNDNALAGDGGFGGELMAVGEYVFWETIRGSANLGFRYRPGERQIQENILGNEITWGLGVHAPFLTDNLDVLGEVAGAVSVQPRPEHMSGVKSGEAPAELRGALRYGVHHDWSVTGGMGAGVGDGIGAPNWRFFVGIDGKWATGGWWRVNYRNPDFEADFDPCEVRDRDQIGRRLRFDPHKDCPEPIALQEDDDPTDLLDGPAGPDDGWEPPEQDDGSDEVADGGDDEEGSAALRQGAIMITEQVGFEVGSADVSEDSFELLDDVATLILRHDDIRLLRIEGHTDSVGRAQMNLELSQERADSVRQYLIDAGVESERVKSIGYGEEEPIADNGTAEGRAQNRRVDFNIMEME